MKKHFLILLFSLAVFGCSSLELEAVSTSTEETQRILALGLTHEENLIEAKKLKSKHKISVVTLQLTNARDEKIQKEIDLIESAKYSQMVLVSDNNSSFVGPRVTSVKKGILESDVETQTHFLTSSRNESGFLQHTLNIIIEHNSLNKRPYLSANLCDEWMRCEGVTSIEQELILISSKGSNCEASGCNFIEEMELNLSDSFLKDSLEKGFTMRFNSKRKSNKIEVTKAYLMGYFEVVK
jgi:hypothetical protein